MLPPRRNRRIGARLQPRLVLGLIFASAMAPMAPAETVRAPGCLPTPLLALHWPDNIGAIAAISVIAILALLVAVQLVRDKRAQARSGRTLLERADCMVWEARVRRAGTLLAWSFTTQPSGLFRRLFADLPAATPGQLWPEVELGNRAEMDTRARAAIESGAPGYQQEFLARKGTTSFWLQEQVTITRDAPDRWHLVGVVTDVTTWRTNEEKLKTKEAQVHEILARADCLLWRARVEREGDQLTWGGFEMPTSGLYPRLFGDRDPAAGSKLWSFLKVPALAEMNARSREAIFSGAPHYEQEFCAITEKETLWLREKVSITPAGPDAVQLAGVLVDVTAQHAAEVERQAASNRYRALFEHTPVAILETNFTAVGAWLAEQRAAGISRPAEHLDTNPAALAAAASRVQVVDANEAALRLFKARDRAEIQARARDLVPGGAFQRLAHALHSGGATLETPMDVCDLEGRVHHTNVRCWLQTRDGTLDLAQVVIAVVDLTEQKRVASALAAEKERLAVTLRTMADGVITTDTRGYVLFINRAAAELTGWNADTAVGRPISEICRLRDARADRDLTLPVAHVVRADTLVDLAPRTELIGHTERRRFVDGCCAPIHAADGVVTGTVFVLRDVTEQEKLEQELLRASKLESVGVLAGGIAHDFNNALTVIVGNLHLAMLAPDRPVEFDRSLREAERAALQARDLTQQLLTFAKGGDPVRAAVHLPDVLRHTAEFTARGSGAKCEFEIPADLWPVDADKAQIGQVVQNLVLNSAQAMPSGGRIRIEARNVTSPGSTPAHLAPGDYVHVSVADTGVGIPPEHIARVFDPYFTTKPHGSGLGLATVYSIIAKHRGLIDLQSELGRGTTFHLWLPALRALARAPARPPTAAQPPLGIRVLLMDDEEPIRRVGARLLQHFGCTVATAPDGQAAVDQYRAAREQGTPFDAVIMDLTIPGGMGGREALEQLRAADPGVKAIVSSGYSGDPVLANFRDYGFCGHVAKPYQPSELYAVLRDVIAER